MTTYHEPVLLKESVDALDIKENGLYVDATYGGGGHSKEILCRLGKKGKLLVGHEKLTVLSKTLCSVAQTYCLKRSVLVRYGKGKEVCNLRTNITHARKHPFALTFTHGVFRIYI